MTVADVPPLCAAGPSNVTVPPVSRPTGTGLYHSWMPTSTTMELLGQTSTAQLGNIWLSAEVRMT